MSAAFNIYVPDLSGDIREPELTARIVGEKADLSFIAELWNAGPIGRAVALQIADAIQPAVKAALSEIPASTGREEDK